MLALLRGRYDAARHFAAEVAEMGARGGVPDTARLVGTVLGPIYADCGPVAELEGGLRGFLDAARRFPGHFYEATAAMLLVEMRRLDEASAELDRVLPRLLKGSGPRWLGSAAHAAEAAAAVGDREACERLFDALGPYSGRFAIWGGANTYTGRSTGTSGGSRSSWVRRTRYASSNRRRSSRSRSARCPAWPAP